MLKKSKLTRLKGTKQIEEQELWEALEIAQAREVVKDKDGELDALVEQGGVNFSGGNLDVTLLERINALGTTVIVVTHERGLVNHFKKRVIYLQEGQVTGDATGRYEGVRQ